MCVHDSILSPAFRACIGSRTRRALRDLGNLSQNPGTTLGLTLGSSSNQVQPGPVQTAAPVQLQAQPANTLSLGDTTGTVPEQTPASGGQTAPPPAPSDLATPLVVQPAVTTTAPLVPPPSDSTTPSAAPPPVDTVPTPVSQAALAAPQPPPVTPNFLAQNVAQSFDKPTSSREGTSGGPSGSSDAGKPTAPATAGPTPATTEKAAPTPGTPMPGTSKTVVTPTATPTASKPSSDGYPTASKPTSGGYPTSATPTTVPTQQPTATPTYKPSGAPTPTAATPTPHPEYPTPAPTPATPTPTPKYPTPVRAAAHRS